MNNFIERKDTMPFKNLNLNINNITHNKKKLSLKQEDNQENYPIRKKYTMCFEKSFNHRSYFLNILKKRVLRKKNLKKEITKERVIELLSKESSSRTNMEIKELGLYLSHNYDFFKKIKEEDGISKLEKIINICHLKKYINDDIIINYEEKKNKVFILLEGNLGLYKPIFIEKMMTPRDFLEILYYIENKQNNHSKYTRIKEKNKENSINISLYEKLNNNEGIMNQKIYFFLEDYEKIDKINVGQIFGANINENKNNGYDISNYTIKSDEESTLIFFDIDEYRKISKKYEEIKFKKDIEKFKNEFPFYKFFSDDKIIDILKKLSTRTLFKDEYLYKQNDKANYIFFVIKGKFNMYSSISFNWLIDYLDYIKDSKTNIIFHLIKKMPKNKDEYKTLIEELQNKVTRSPMTKQKISFSEKINEKENEKCIFGIKNQEESLNDSKTLFKLNIKNIKEGDMVGIEDSMELKNRYCSVKCVSDIAEVKFISIYDLIKVIKIYHTENNYMNNYLLEFISKIKFMLYQQIIKDLQHLENKLTFEFDNKYNDLIKSNTEVKSRKEENLSIAAIKVKGFKYDIKEVFDKNIPIFPDYKKSNSQNYFLKNQLILKGLIGSQKKKNKRIMKFKQQNSKQILFLNDRNIISNNIINNERINRALSNTERSDRNLAYKYSSCDNKSSKKFDISLSTNFSNYTNNTKIYNEKRKGKFKFKLSSNNIIKNKTIQNYLTSSESVKELKKNYLNELNFNSYKKTNINTCNNFVMNNSPLYESNKKTRNNKNINNNKLDSFYKDKRNYHSLKNIKNDKRVNGDCIEFILKEKFSEANKKYYLGNQFKNKLDKEKKKFNLIHYKQYFNKS